MGKNTKILGLFFLSGIVLLVVLIPALRMTNTFRSRAQVPPPGTIVQPITPTPGGDQKKSLQLHTFPFATLPPGTTPQAPVVNPPTNSPTNTPVNNPTTPPNLPPGTKIPVKPPIIGGPNPPANHYCIDDQDPDMCDDSSSHIVPFGVGGATGPCGKIIDQAHKLVAALPQVMKGTRDSLTRSVTTSCHTTGPSSGYVSTYFVIDAFNLAGFKELSKTNSAHVSPTGLYNWWQSPPPGYVFVPYSPSVVQAFGNGQRDLTGCAMFLKTGSGYHIGIVNRLELFTPGGDGVISILQSGSRMYIDRFPVAGWSIQNTSTNQTSTSGVIGFGCHI
ncbi:MAG TPA: hypothetical protein VNA13_01575 [Xanthomonadales bacterium]|nr:hypothetical protein [Xanthomonadales bacterium]